MIIINGQGVYADYPYSGTLPDYPMVDSPPPLPPVPPPPPDPPADPPLPTTVTDLTIVARSRTWMTLQWTATDNGSSGKAKWYDFRYSTTGPITESNFYSAVHIEIPFFPHTPGQGEGVTIIGLVTYTVYWFAVKVSDDVPNWSNVSNSPTARTKYSGSDLADPLLDIMSPELLSILGIVAIVQVGAEVVMRRKRTAPVKSFITPDDVTTEEYVDVDDII